jgi:cyclic beta-1,2-glucan synthetase
MAFIDLNNLELFAENISANLSSSKTSTACKIRRRLIRNLGFIKATADRIISYKPTSGMMPKEFEWLIDNRYIAEREGRGAVLMLKRTGKLAASRKGYPKIFGLAVALVKSGNGIVTKERIQTFLSGAQKAGAFSEKELWLFTVMLKTALVFELHKLVKNFHPIIEEYSGAKKGIYSAELEMARIRAEGGVAPEEIAQAASEAEKAHSDFSGLASNIFTSLRFLSTADLRDLLHSQSAVEQILSRDPSGIYPSMDEESRAQYRRIISRLAQRRKMSEASAAKQAIYLSENSTDPQCRHVGYYLIQQPLGKQPSKWYRPLYFILFIAVTILFAALVLLVSGPVATLLLLIPLSGVSKNICDTLALKVFHPARLPRLELKNGIPDDAKTLCVISVLLTGEKDGKRFASLLERYMLANRNAGTNLLFGLLADMKDADSKNADNDEAILSAVREEIARLNNKYGYRFYFFIRDRIYNPSEKRFMSWERKRGALIELSRLLLDKQCGLRIEEGNPDVLKDIRYVVTLDSDTRLTVGSAVDLLGTMLHPLNRPVLDYDRRIVREGHALLQPRISVDLEAASKSFFSRAFAGLGGTDPYGSTVSDLYQDLFDEGIFTGKGIFDVEVFSQCLDDRFPDNRILSHDLLEGCYLRAALVSDVELTDGFPYKVNSWFSRLHRWTRGDWQLLPWLFKKVPSPGGKEENPLSPLSRWKIFDNLRRSLVPVFTFATILWGILFDGLWAAAGVAVAISLSELALSTATALLRGGYELGSRYHSSILYGVRGSAVQTALQIMLLPYHAMVCLDAIITSLYRVFISKKHLLQWVTAEQSERQSTGSITGMYRTMLVSVIWGGVSMIASNKILAYVLGACWILSPLISAIISRPTKNKKVISQADRDFLLDQSKLMWDYFEDFLNPSNNYLPPDNWQEQPAVGVARRTSPTNIGLALLCCLAAYDLKLADLNHILDKIELMLDSIERLQKWKGHPLNWYDTSTLKPLYPMSVSSVDSGNLAACYIALISGLNSLGTPRATGLAERTRSLLDAMDFLALFDTSRNLFYISIDIETGKPSESWYDLLASEARQTSYICIARGIIDKKHWRRLGRALVQKNGYSGMASWTGTMFEYLMPNLLMPTFPNSLIYESLRFCVYCQKLRGDAFKIPWGISESAFFAFDRALNYQYKAHGVQRLAFKRGMNRELVISPYSTFLALEVEPAAAIKNLHRLKELGLEGRYGLYEAADFTPNRQVSGQSFEQVMCFMAHHIGMSLIACDNLLNEQIMQKRFMSDAEMDAFSELLQERTPVDAVTVRASFNEVPEKPKRSTDSEWSLALAGYDAFRPRCHLLSNGSYSIVLTNTGLSSSVSDGIMLNRFDGSLIEGVCGIYFFFRTKGRMYSLTPAPFFDRNVQYSAELEEKGAKLFASFDGIRTCITVCVPNRDKAELREIKIQSSSDIEGELICYFEPILTKQDAYQSHPAFSKLFLETESRHNGVLVRRRPREGGDPLYLSFICSAEGASYSTSREKSLGRGGFEAIRRLTNKPLSLTEGPVIDPCVIAKIPVEIEESESKIIRFALSFSSNSESAVSAAERTLAMPYRQASSRPIGEYRRLSLTQSEVNTVLEFAGELLFLSPGRRALAKYILQNQNIPAPNAKQPANFDQVIADTLDGVQHLGQSALWKYGISGDIPIIAAVCGAETAPDIISRTIRQHRLLTLGGIKCDLVLLFSEGSDYRRPARTAALDIIRSIGAENMLSAQGGIHLLDLVPADRDFSLIAACASVLIDVKGEPVATERSAAHYPVTKKLLKSDVLPDDKPNKLQGDALQSNNKSGLMQLDRNLQYHEDGSVSFEAGKSLPASAWSNVLTNGDFSYIATDSGSGYMWRLNARENRINAWINDTLAIEGEERVYLNFGKGSVSVFASDDSFPCTVTYGPGYAVWEKEIPTGTIKTTAFVHKDLPCRVVKITYSGVEKATLNYFSGLVLGDNPSMRRHVITFEDDGIIRAINRYNSSYRDQVVLFASSPGYSEFTCDRADALSGILKGNCGAGLDPCVCFRVQMDKGSVILLTAANNEKADMSQCLKLLDDSEFESALDETKRHWTEIATPITIDTPSDDLNRYINSWALYQTIACRIFARSSMYQSGGAYGFRDQLQDACAALLSDPEIAKEQILRAAAHQFEEGDVQHWWHPSFQEDIPEKGVRTRCSDDLLWLPYTVCEYIEKTADTEILDIKVPFLISEPLKSNEHERYETVRHSEETADIYNHCIRALDMAILRGNGQHGLSLIGTGDWNDGFNLVGAQGRGESVWLTWFLAIVLRRFVPLCKERGDEKKSQLFTAYAENLLKAAERAWDGSWYKRAYFDSGAPLGSHTSEECKIDSIAQSFAVLAGADRTRCKTALNSAIEHLVDKEARMVKLFTPPFRDSKENPGYIMGYLEGVRENGGQYTHAAIWLAMGCLEFGLNNEGFEILEMLLPSTHDESIYRIEPYVLAADVYSNYLHRGRGGWSWYTGSSSWYYRVTIQNLLGIKITGDGLYLSPKIPDHWEGFSARVRFMNSQWNIDVVHGERSELFVDGKKLSVSDCIPRTAKNIKLIIPKRHSQQL